MRSKRLLTMLLAIVMVLSVLSPAATAVTPAENTVMNPGDGVEVVDTTTKSEASEFDNDLVVSEDASANGVKTLRDEDKLMVNVEEVETVQGEGTWTATESDVTPSVSLFPDEVPACIEELQEAAEVFEKDEKVVAFVVMEQAPLSESVNSISRVAPADEAQLLSVQDAVIEDIEKEVLSGKALEVRYQFTYLTNSFTIETEFQNLEKIAMMDGVKSVFVMPVYDALTVESAASPNTFSAGEMTGVTQVWADLGYTGAGMKIAVIDTGLDLDHPSFVGDPETTESSMTVADIEAVLTDLNAYKQKSSLTASDLYRSAKVPYAFNYVDNSLTADHTKDQQGDHGTHVAGIAAANALDTTDVVGMAPDAQIIVMKVFGANGGAYTDDIVAALEDAMTLGCDVVNASLGSPAGFSSTDTEIDLIYERLASQDIVACISAGNEGTSSYANMWGTDLNRTQNPDNATIGQPGIFANVMTIASADNAKVYANYMALADGTAVVYNGSYEWYYGEVTGLETLVGQELEYAVVDGLGNAEDFYAEDGTSLVSGKVAVVSRGEISFGEKVQNAADAGAVACLVWNNVSGNVLEFYMSITLTAEDGTEYYPDIPCGMISLEDGQIMKDAETKTLTIEEEQTITDSATAGQMSSFSSWGVSPELGLEPDITGVGGSVYSCYDGGTYGYMSGTSMSSPQVAGVTALVMQRLYELYPDAPDATVRNLAEALLMSTADPIVADYAEASPRQQGAGLVDAYEAVTSEVYLTVGGEKPKAELGDNANGKYSFSFEINNFSDKEVTYVLDASLLTEYVAGYYVDEEQTEVEYFMAGFDIPLTGTVTFDEESVTVPAGGKSDVKVTIELSDEDKAYFDAYWENGGYVEGFVYLNAVDEEGVVTSQLNLPFLGFYGDWTEAPVFDTAYWYGNGFWGAGDGSVEGDEYYHVFWTDLAGTDWVLGFNPYSGAIADDEGNVIYDPAHNVVSPNGDGAIDGLDEIYLSLLRNAKTMTFTYTVNGEVVERETFTNNSKSMYMSSYGQVVPWLYSWYGEGMYDFTDANGNVLPDGTEVILTIDANVDYGTGGDHTMTVPMYVDNTAPELVEVYEIEQDGTYYMVVEAADATDLAAVYVMNSSGSRIYAAAYDYAMEQTEEGTWLAYFDVTDLGTNFVVALCDYGANEGYYDVTYECEGDNLPDMTDFADDLFAYRVYDSEIYSDHMYGWVSMNKPEASTEETTNYTNISVWTDDYMEYAAINAAEYVDGKIFAVDAVYNLVVMEPGLFDRQTIRNLGMNVLDMSFDDSTDTMYVLTRDADKYVTLNEMDLLTGELTLVYDYGYYYYAPYAIADDDNGTLYAIKYAGANLYTLSAANEWAMTTVTDAEGNAIVIKDSNGSNANPQYAQGLTYENGNLYWAYYKYSYSGGSSELITINTADWTYYGNAFAATGYDADYNLVEYYPATELVGLLSLTDTEYVIPEATAIDSVLLSTDSLLMKVGDTATVTASALPWNYEVQEMTWSSSDETVATVVDGKVVGVGEGTATITVNVDGIEETLEVKVVLVEGHFNAYNYYSYDGYYGYMIDVDMETMDYYLNSAAPVDFIAGDYNGHDGCFYGYTEVGQLYKWDMEQNELYEIGQADEMPIDMAYDYSTGLMYGLFTNLNSYESEIKVINMKTGATMTVLDITGDYGMVGYFTLACDDMGTLYTMDYQGYLYTISYVYDDWFETWSYQMNYSNIYDSLGSISYVQSMCWDHANDVLLWAHCDGNSINWIDVNEGYMLKLGDPTESGLFEFVGLYTVPETILPLPYTAVESVEANDMLLLVGGSKAADITVYPFNATNQDLVLTSADESIAKVENGVVYGVAEGETTISYTLTDGENVIEGTINVTVLQGADNVYGQILSDLAYGSVQNWAQIYPEDTVNVNYLAYEDYVVFAAEYVDGKLYAYGYDPYDWTANWQYMVLDPETFAVESMTDMGDSFPYVYDMTYDYATGTMFCVAGSSEDDMNLYMADKDTGAVTLLVDTDQNFMSIAAAEDGMLYAIENSVSEYDYETWSSVYTNAQLYSINAKTLEITYVGDTGMQCDMIASMAYDHDTNVMYWTPLSYNGNGVSGLAIVDLETGAATNLGTIGASGSQVAGLYIVADEYPEVDTSALYNVIVSPTKVSLNVGQSTSLSLNTIPMNLDGAEIVWTSSDNEVATVDENGTVTALMQGKAEITATVTYNGTTKTGTCTVSILAEDASFLTWNRTDMGWSEISRADYSVVTNLTEGEEVGVTAIGVVGKKVYGYDSNNVLFKLNTEDYTRTAIGDSVAEYAINQYIAYVQGEDSYSVSDFVFEVRDMEYDSMNGRMLVLGAVLMYDADTDASEEINYGCAVYSVDLTTGELTELYRFTDFYYVYSLAAGTDGTVYFYTTFDDGIYKLDVDNGTYSKLVSLQTQSLYGEYGGDIRQAMYYDDLTDTIYMTFTSNGKYYRMLTIDAVTGAITATNAEGSQMYIGEMVKVGYSYTTDLYSGLVFVNEYFHVCEFGEWTVTTAATCTEPGVETRTCECGETETREIPALGHSYEDGECTVCGEKDPDYTEPSTPSEPEHKHCYGEWITVKDPTSKETGLQERYCECGAKEQKVIDKLTNPFTDVKEDAYYYEPVLWAVYKGVTAGIREDAFGPNNLCTRAQVVTFLWRAYGSPEPESTENPFTDVTANSYYYKAVLWAVENGITAGVSSDKFGPSMVCTRAQVVTFLWRAAGSPESKTTKNPFADVTEKNYYYEPVLWAVENGITAGVDATHFGSSSNCTRAQIVTFLYKAVN